MLQASHHCLLLTTCRLPLPTHYSLQSPHHLLLLATRCLLLPTHYSLRAPHHCLLLTTCCLLLPTYYSLQAPHHYYTLPATYCLLLTSHYLLLTTHYLPTIYYLRLSTATHCSVVCKSLPGDPDLICALAHMEQHACQALVIGFDAAVASSTCNLLSPSLPSMKCGQWPGIRVSAAEGRCEYA